MGFRERIKQLWNPYDSIYLCQNGDIISTERGPRAKIYALINRKFILSGGNATELGVCVGDALRGRKVRIVNYDDMSEGERDILERAIERETKEADHELKDVHRKFLDFFRGSLRGRVAKIKGVL